MYEERVVLPDGKRLDLRFESQTRYWLRVQRGAQVLVEYRNDGKGHRRRVRGRDLVYEFRSVEQLRYDFERDVEEAQRQG